MKKPEKKKLDGRFKWTFQYYRNKLINKVIDDCEAYYEFEIRKLKKQLEMSKYREAKLCGDHSGKQLGQKMGCIACEVEHYTSKRIREEK